MDKYMKSASSVENTVPITQFSSGSVIRIDYFPFSFYLLLKCDWRDVNLELKGESNFKAKGRWPVDQDGNYSSLSMLLGLWIAYFYFIAIHFETRPQYQYIALLSTQRFLLSVTHIFQLCFFTGRSYFSMVVNFMMGAVAVFHLAYLGIMFGSSSQEQESGYSMTHTLQKWSGLSFASHWIVIICYIVYAIV